MNILQDLCLFPDLAAAGVSDSGAVSSHGLAAVRLLQILVYLDDPVSADGIYRILHEAEQMVGTADPSADDRNYSQFAVKLFLHVSVLYAQVYSDYTVLYLHDDPLSDCDI